MNSREYRAILSKLVQNVMRKQFPGLKKDILILASCQIAVLIHARMYGANVDNVDSPLWRDSPKDYEWKQPDVDASELLGNLAELKQEI